MKRNKGDQCFDSLPVIRSLSSPWCLAIRWLQFIPTLCWIIAYLQFLVNESQNIKRKRVFRVQIYDMLRIIHPYRQWVSNTKRFFSSLHPPQKFPTRSFGVGCFRLCLNFSFHEGNVFQSTVIVTMSTKLYDTVCLSIYLNYIWILYVIHTVHFLIISMLSNHCTSQ